MDKKSKINLDNQEFRSFIFTHIPKCGGTSFRNYLYNTGFHSGFAEESMYIPGFGSVNNDENLNQLDEAQLTKIRERYTLILADHTPFNGHLHYKLNTKKPFYYTILRDPIERFVSHYNFFYYHLGYDECKGLKLDDLPANKLEDLLKTLSNVQVKYISGFNEMGQKEVKPLSQLFYVARFNLKKRFHCVGILSRMDESLNLLKKMSPNWMSFVGELGMSNVNKQMMDKSVSPRVRELIRKANHFDMELYSLGLDLFDKYLNENV